MSKLYKQVAVARVDLPMTHGKLAAQTGHAFVDAYQKALDLGVHDWIAGWREGGDITKIVLGIEGEDALRDIHNKAIAANLPCAFIVDYGRTELAGYNATCMAIGPAPGIAIDQITGHLNLYRAKK